MTVIRQKLVQRSDLKNNPDVYYLFGDNEKRQGLGGQAAEMRGEPNAIGVRTKYSPSHADGAFWSDDHYDKYVQMITDDLKPAAAKLVAGGTVVIPTDGLGTGLSKLPTKAPLVFEALQSMINELIQYKGAP